MIYYSVVVYIGTKKIKLGVRRIHRGHGRKRRLIEIADTLVYVPLLESLQTLLKDEGIYTEVQTINTYVPGSYCMHIYTVGYQYSCIYRTRNIKGLLRWNTLLTSPIIQHKTWCITNLPLL